MVMFSILWEPTTVLLQSNYQLLVDRQGEGSSSWSAWTMAAPTPIGLGTVSNSEQRCGPHRASESVGAALFSRQLIWSACSNSESPSTNTISRLQAGRRVVSAGGGVANGSRRQLLESSDGFAVRRLAVAVCAPDDLSCGKSSSDWLTSVMWSASLFTVASSAEPSPMCVGAAMVHTDWPVLASPCQSIRRW
jgi:hypothetical protein